MILLTRSANESEKLAETLTKWRFECLIEPMITIRRTNPDMSSFFSKSVQAFIATSRNGRLSAPAGYKLAAIPENGKNAGELYSWIIKNLKPLDGKLIYLRGNVISFDIAKHLRSQGFTVDEVIVYQSTPATDLSDDLLDNFDKIKLATFFSAITLKTFLQQVKKYEMTEKLQNIKVLVMSEELAALAEAVTWKEVHISAEPTLNAMIHKIHETYE